MPVILTRSSLFAAAPLFAAALLTAIVAWLSQGSVAIVDGGGRIALLPYNAGALTLAAVAAGATTALIRRTGTMTPLWLLAIPLLPWLPFGTPVLLMWSGPLVLAPWVALFLVLFASSSIRVALPAVLSSRPALVAGMIATAIYAIAAWQVAPSRPGGDEPHYLVITQSLLLDHDLKIENNHRRGDYRAYYPGDLSKPDYYRRGRDGEIYSVHAPGVSVLVLPAFAIAGYRGVVAFLIALAGLTAGLAWRLARRVTGRDSAAWFGWAAVVLSSTLLLNAFTVYPDGPGGFLVLTGVWALVRARDERASGAESARPWLLHGAALAVLPWLHTRFALIAGGLGALVMLELARTKNPAAKGAAFLVVPAASALAWVAFFVAIYGVPDPAIPYRGSDLGSTAYIAGGLAGLFFDQLYGLFVYAPVLVAAIAGLAVMPRVNPEFKWLPAELGFVMIPYLLTVTHFAMWWGGFTSPARFLVPLLPALAIPAAAAWAAAGRPATRTTLAALLVTTALIAMAVVFVGGGRLAYFARDVVYSGVLDWANRAADLQHGLPSFFSRARRGEPGSRFYAEIAIWIAALASAWLLVRAADRTPPLSARARLATATVLAFAAAVMIAVAIVWKIEGVTGVEAAAQVDLLRTAGASHKILALDLSRLRRITPSELPDRLVVRLEASPGAPPAPGRDDRPIFSVPQLPAGDYLVHIDHSGNAGWIMLGVGRDQFSLLTQPVSYFEGQVRVRFPVDVRAIVVRGDEDARKHVRGLTLRPVAILTPDLKAAGDFARHAVRYGDASFYFMDDRSFPEPNAFWVGGARESTIVVQPDAPRSSTRLTLRNAPAENDVKLQAGGWAETLHLSSGEERIVNVPLDTARGATAITIASSSGFRPSDSDPSNRDPRFLGVYVIPVF